MTITRLRPSLSEIDPNQFADFQEDVVVEPRVRAHVEREGEEDEAEREAEDEVREIQDPEVAVGAGATLQETLKQGNPMEQEVGR